jgi:hypothetical protein
MSDEPKVEPKGDVPDGTKDQPTKTSSEDIEQFMAELEKAEVTTPQQLQGNLANARDYHKIQGERDQLMNKLGEMEKKMDGLKQPPKADEWEGEAAHTSQPLNLKEEFIAALREVKTQEQQESMKIQQQQLEAWDAITGDPSYPQVKEIWEQRLKEPRFLAEINSGRKHPLDAYKDVVIEHQKLTLVKASQMLKQLHGKGTIATPHVETGDKGGLGPEAVIDKNAETLKRTRADVNKGRRLTENEELDLLDIALSGK